MELITVVTEIFLKQRTATMGRQREFCVEKALDAAMCVFWRKGYEGASYADLVEATGVERPALYSAFGNKEALFRQALEHYSVRYADFTQSALELPTSREVISSMLNSSADLVTRYPEHPGCLGVHGVLAGSDASEPVRQTVVESRAIGEAALRERLEKAKAEGDLPETTDPASLAAYVMAVMHGMAVQAKAGFSREKLGGVIEQTVRGWPGR